MTVFLAFLVSSFVFGSVRPAFFALPMLLIIEPVSLVKCSVCMRVSASAVCFVIQPLSFIHIAISMNKFPNSICLIITPIPFILRPIRPDLDSLAISFAVHPLPCIHSAILQSKGRFPDSFIIMRHLKIIRCHRSLATRTESFRLSHIVRVFFNRLHLASPHLALYLVLAQFLSLLVFLFSSAICRAIVSHFNC